ncbi:MAG: hypothetical protein P0111_02335 [Nitrospira sp.]|nr:hypothetical protein [Nitrospira sp.]
MSSGSRRVRPFILALLLVLIPFASAHAFDNPRLASVPALAVLSDGRTGVVHYIAIQISSDPGADGPVIQFSEINLGGGSLVGDDWKAGVRQAVLTALRHLGTDGRDWVVTIKNRSHNAMTDGMSASGAIAVGIMAAWRGETIRPGVALTGQIAPNGDILAVGSVPQKVEAAAREQFKTVLVPRGQSNTAEWDFSSRSPRVTILEVGTLDDAYQAMAGLPR